MADNELTERITIRCSLSQKSDLWEKAASIDRRALAEWIRITLDDAAEKMISEHEQSEKERK